MASRNTLLPGLAAILLLGLPAAPRVAAQAPAAATAPKPDRRALAMERVIADLHGKLAITAAEQAPFDALAQVMRENARRMDTLVQARQQTAASGTALTQMQSYSDMAQAHAEDMKRLTAAFSTLYNGLSDDQKKQADQSFRQFAKLRRPMPG